MIVFFTSSRSSIYLSYTLDPPISLLKETTILLINLLDATHIISTSKSMQFAFVHGVKIILKKVSE